VFSFGAFGQEHTEDHAVGPPMGGPSDSLQNPPRHGTLPQFAGRGGFSRPCELDQVRWRSSLDARMPTACEDGSVVELV
jgi:hypothetical protein